MDRNRVLAGWAALLALAALTVLSLRAVSPPAPRPADAPADQFSAGRAYELVDHIGSHVHVAGSDAAGEVRDFIVTTLTGLGLQTRVQDGVGANDALGGFAMAHVRNVIGVLPGTASTGRVFLVAHYDSVQVSYGGSDDGAGVATLLETARAMAAGPEPRNDIVFVFTEAEEACLCGAEAFVSQDPLARDGGVALNFEARGLGRSGHHVRDVGRQRRRGRRVRVVGALPGGDQLRGRGVPDPAQRHRLHRVPYVGAVHRAQHGLHRRFRGLSLAGGQAVLYGQRQPAAPREQRSRPGPRVRWGGSGAAGQTVHRGLHLLPGAGLAACATPADWSGRWPGWP